MLGEKVIAAYREPHHQRASQPDPQLSAAQGFYGLKVHEAALDRGVKVTGATVHLVNEECDGGPILLQKGRGRPARTTPPRRCSGA